MDLSVVVPIYNEELSVQPLYEAITRALNKLNLNYEILFVDDGSSDNTYLNSKDLAEKDSHLKVVKLKRNYGQTIGLHAGFQNATGKMIVTMDGDLQNDPEDIGQMIEKIKEGNDIVLGWRHNRQDKIISRKIPSKIANWLISKLTGVPVKDNGCAIRAYRAEIIKKFPMYSEMHRLLPVMTALSGAKFTQIKVKHHARKFGSSKYGLSRIYKVMIDMVALKIIFTFFYLPLYGFGVFALIFGILCIITMLLGLFQILLYPGTPLITVMGASLLFGSLSLFLLFLGIISDLIYQTGDIKIERLLKTRRMKEHILKIFSKNNS